MALFNWFKKNIKQKEDLKKKDLQDDILKEQVELSQEQDDILEEQVELSQEQDDILEEQVQLSQEQDDTLEEQVQLSQEQDDALEEQVKLSQEQDDTLEKQVELSQEQDDTLEEQVELLQEQDDTLEEQVELSQEQDDTLKEQVELSQEQNDVSEQVEPKIKKESFFAKIKKGISKTRDSILNGVENVLKSFSKIDEELFEELEETLIMSDIGVETSCFIIDKVRDIVKQEKIKEVSEIKQVIVRVIADILQKDTNELELKSPSVILIIGVNGVGKTTTIGKLTNNYKNQGKKVVLGAADTFRAAAIDQLQIWAERNNVDIIKHQENSDPTAVVFDAVQASKARNADLLICDTAGRLHNKKNLMEELKKISRIIDREFSSAQVETFLVLDATTGQNALQQAKVFSEVTNITGLILTKLDGTAKGGVIISIANELKIPVRFIGVGESIDDLRPFDAKEFSNALFQ